MRAQSRATTGAPTRNWRRKSSERVTDVFVNGPVGLLSGVLRRCAAGALITGLRCLRLPGSPALAYHGSTAVLPKP